MDPVLFTGVSSGTRTLPLRRGRMLWHVATSAPDEFALWLERNFGSSAGFTDDPSQHRSVPGARIFKEYGGCRVSAMDGLVLKEYWPRPGWKGVRFAVMPSRASRGFVLARRLARCGIPTPEAVAWAVQRKFAFKLASYVVTREIKEAVPLTEWLENNPNNMAAGAGVMGAYGRLMALFHANGYSNRDFKHENVMCAVKSPADLQVVDLDGVSRKFYVTRRRAGKDLMRVGLSLGELGWRREPDVCAFFGGYNAIVPARLMRKEFPA